MDQGLNAIKFNDTLNDFCNDRGTDTAIMEDKLAQQMAFMEQELWFMAFINLKKAFDSMEQEQCLDILLGYGVGPNMCRLIKKIWDKAVLVCRAQNNFGVPFKA